MTTQDTGNKPAILKDLRLIPGVGDSVARDLYDLGYRSASDLKDEDPEAMYQKLIAMRGAHQDRCLLYVFRCGVYFASRRDHDPQKLKWWNWKD